MHELPVVDGLERLFLAQVHGVAQMNRQLSYVDEHVLVGELGIARVDLDKRTLHEVYHGQRVDRREFRVARKRQIQRLKIIKI